MNLECELPGVLVLPDRSLGLRVADRRDEQVEPRTNPLEGEIANGPRMRVELRGNGGEEAPPGEEVVLDVLEKALSELLQPVDPVGARRAGSTTCSAKIVFAVSMVASCSSSLEPKCANSPLLLIPTASANRAMERPVRPSTVASLAASSRIARRLRSPSLRRRRSAGSGTRRRCFRSSLDKLARTFVYC